MPGQQFGDAVDGMVGDAADHLAQIGFRIEAVELGGFDKRLGYGTAPSAGIGSGEQIVLPPRPAASCYAYCHN